MLLLGMRSVTRSIPEELYSDGGIVVIMRSPCHLRWQVGRLRKHVRPHT
jgi:hypothetical protein